MALVSLVAVGVAGLSVALATGDDDGSKGCGLSSKKKDELAKTGVTVKMYCDEEARVKAHRKAFLESPPPDPKVVAPRLVTEAWTAELAAWQARYSKQARARLHRRWAVPTSSEQRTIVTLDFVTDHATVVAGPARWAINVPLNRALTPDEQRRLEGSRGIEPINRLARKLVHMPPPTSLRGPVELEGTVALLPRHGRFLVDITPYDSLDPGLVMRRGRPDDALLRGKQLLRHAPKRFPPLNLRLSSHPAVTYELYDSGRTRKQRKSSLRELRRLFKLGPVPVLLRWSTRSPTLRAQVLRLVEGLVLLPRTGP